MASITSDVETRGGKVAVRSIVPSLSFKDRAEEAVNFYVSVFKNSRIVSIDRWPANAPIPEGKVLNATFELNGREYRAFDGGEHFTFTDAFSLVAICETQRELDEVWGKLASGGGQEGPCGWVTDRFGVSWQVIPAALEEIMANPKGGNSKAVMDALLQMGKLDLKRLEAAYKQR